MTGDKEGANRAFEAVKGLGTPYELTLQATISQLAVASVTQQPAVRSVLEKMRRKTQNENDLEKIQTALERKQTDNTNRTKFPKQTSAIVPSDCKPGRLTPQDGRDARIALPEGVSGLSERGCRVGSIHS